MKPKQLQESEKNKICFRCKNKIAPKCNYVELITWNDEKIISSVYFHLPCWGGFNQDKVNERIKEMAAFGLKSIQPLLSSLQQ